jgi:hypothetical protein
MVEGLGFRIKKISGIVAASEATLGVRNTRASTSETHDLTKISSPL